MQWPDQKWRTVAILFAIAGLNYADRTAIAAVFPVMRSDLGLSDLAMAAIGSIFLWTYALGSPVAGYLADRLSRSRMIFWSLLCWSVATAATGLAHNLNAVLATRVLLGMAECIYLPAAVALIADHHPPQTRATAMGIHNCGLNLGLIAGGFASGYIGDHFGWRLNFFVLGGLGIVLALIARAFLHDAGSARPAAASQSGIHQLGGLFRVPTYVALAAEAMLISVGTWMFFNWLPLFYKETYNLSLAAAGFSGTFMLQAAAVIGMAGGGYLSDKLTRSRLTGRILMLSLSYFAAAPFLLTFLTRPGFTLVSAAIFLYSLLRTLGTANEHPIVCELLPSNLRATAVGLMNTVNCTAGGIGVMIAGYLKRDYGLSGVFGGVSICVFAAALVMLWAWIHLLRRRGVGIQPDPAPVTADKAD